MGVRVPRVMRDGAGVGSGGEAWVRAAVRVALMPRLCVRLIPGQRVPSEVEAEDAGSTTLSVGPALRLSGSEGVRLTGL